MTAGPPGHMPGFHVPGTLVPIGYVMDVQRRQQRADDDPRQAQEEQRRQEEAHLLQLRPR